MPRCINVLYFYVKGTRSYRIELLKYFKTLADICRYVCCDEMGFDCVPELFLKVFLVATGQSRDVDINLTVDYLPTSMFVLNIIEAAQYQNKAEPCSYTPAIVQSGSLLLEPNKINLFGSMMYCEEFFAMRPSKAAKNIGQRYLIDQYTVVAVIPCSFLEQIGCNAVFDVLACDYVESVKIHQQGRIYLLYRDGTCFLVFAYVICEQLVVRLILPVFDLCFLWKLADGTDIASYAEYTYYESDEDYQRTCRAILDFGALVIPVEALFYDLAVFFNALLHCARRNYACHQTVLSTHGRYFQITQLDYTSYEVYLLWNQTTCFLDELQKKNKLAEFCTEFEKFSLFYFLDHLRKLEPSAVRKMLHCLTYVSVVISDKARKAMLQYISAIFANYDLEKLHESLADVVEAMLPSFGLFPPASMDWIKIGSNNYVADARMKYYLALADVAQAAFLIKLREPVYYDNFFPYSASFSLVLLTINDRKYYHAQFLYFQLVQQWICSKGDFSLLNMEEFGCFIAFAQYLYNYSIDALHAYFKDNGILFRVATALFNFYRLQKCKINFLTRVFDYSGTLILFAVSLQQFDVGYPVNALHAFYYHRYGICKTDLMLALTDLLEFTDVRRLYAVLPTETRVRCIYVHNFYLFQQLGRLYFKQHFFNILDAYYTDSYLVMRYLAFERVVEHLTGGPCQLRFSRKLSVEQLLEVVYSELCDMNYLLPDWQFDVVYSVPEQSAETPFELVCSKPVKVVPAYCFIEGCFCEHFAYPLAQLLVRECPRRCDVYRNALMRLQVEEDISAIRDCLLASLSYFDYLRANSEFVKSEQHRLRQSYEFYRQYLEYEQQRYRIHVTANNETLQNFHYNLAVQECVAEFCAAQESMQRLINALTASKSCCVKFDYKTFLKQILAD